MTGSGSRKGPILFSKLIMVKATTVTEKFFTTSKRQVNQDKKNSATQFRNAVIYFFSNNTETPTLLMKAAGKGLLAGTLLAPVTFATHALTSSKFRSLKMDHFNKNNFIKSLRFQGHLVRKSMFVWTMFSVSLTAFFNLFWCKLPISSDFAANVTGFGTFAMLWATMANHRPFWVVGILGGILGNVIRRR